MSECFYRDRDGNPLEALEWMRLFEDAAYRQVDRTDVGELGYVSTVWLGFDPPHLFETMHFPTNWCRRYATLDEARRGHLETVAAVRRGELAEVP